LSRVAAKEIEITGRRTTWDHSFLMGCAKEKVRELQKKEKAASQTERGGAYYRS